ncbi:MAG TPA: peptide-methionine (S)-S-oxide reductase MsrA [Thermoplasmata archaeon]|nr:peptide-methionine (S)-S-oxide reductase MsrA [Thermoplasmata archaeon]
MAAARPGAEGGSEQVTIGGGCFWCTEAVFSELAGVEQVLPGYSGGTAPNPSYEDVCSGDTGHAEVVEIRFRPSVLPLHDLLTVFLATHDPTTKNRQGADVGTQYRSIILYRNDAQRTTAERTIEEMDGRGLFGRRIVTEVVPFRAFYPAEEYHRDYFRRNPDKSYCQIVIAPKVAKFRKEFAARLAKR